MRIEIPAQINADGLLPFLATLDKPLSPQEAVELDFSTLRRVTPAGLACLAATVSRWRRENRQVDFIGLKTCPITNYLQRMDLFVVCGIAQTESFKRHDAKGRFVPVRVLDHRIDQMGTDLANCLAPGGEEFDHPMAGLHDFAWYVLTETGNNVRQHSRGLGYVAAQVSLSEGMVRIALSDNGIGILKSFQDAGLAWSRDITEADAILKALEPKVSSKGSPANEGVGLTLVAGLARRVRGWLMLISGTGVLIIRGGSEPTISTLPNGSHYQGTLLALTFRQEDVQDFADLLHQAKIDSGLLQGTPNSITFEP